LTARPLSLALAIAALKGALLLALVPAFQTPDEYGHYDYVLYLSRVSPAGFLAGRGMDDGVIGATEYATREIRCLAEASGAGGHLADAEPIEVRPLGAAARQAADCRHADTREALEAGGRFNLLSNYPPLYYFAMSLVVRAARDIGVNPLVTYHGVRAISILLLCAAIAVAVRLFGRLGVGTGVTFAAAMVLALHPQLSMLSVSVQPDVLGLVLVTFALLRLVVVLERPGTREAAWLGAALGLLLLTKLHLALPVIGTGAVAGLVGVRRGRGRNAVRAALVSATVAACVGGWWYLRSWLLFGNVMGLMETGRDTGSSGSFLVNLRHFVELRGAEVLRSYWGVWGWLDYGLPHWLLPWLGLLVIGPAVLLLAGAHMVRWAPPAGRARAGAPARSSPGDSPAVEPGSEAAVDPLNGRGLLMIALAFALFAGQMVAITGLYGLVNDQGRHWLGYAAVHALYLAAPLLLLTPARLEAMKRWAAENRRLLRTAAAAASALTLALAFASLSTRAPLGFLEVTMRSSVDGTAEVYVDSGAGYSAVERERTAVRQRDGLVTYEFPLRARRIERLRFDPLATSGTVEVTGVAILERDGTLLQEIDLSEVTPLRDLAAPDLIDGGLRLTALRDAVDPQAEIRFEAPIVMEPGTILRKLDAPRSVLLRAYRRVPVLQALAVLWPWTLVTALSLGAALQLPRRRAWTRADAVRLQGVATATWSLVLLALNVWLMALTWRYYHG
jgi:hypothetical protein